ncbi:MAG: hypothetical protein H6821_06205 [Planctomycetaceae bacterium]|nr:hypothetical protein [Planctomycetaceae bacterium]
MILPRHPTLAALMVSACVLSALPKSGITLAQSGVEAHAVRTNIAPGGMGRYERGRWSVVSVQALNGGDEATEATLSVFFEGDSRKQYTRRAWVPPHAIRQTWLPILPPKDIPLEQTTLHVSSLNIITTANGESLFRKEGAQLIPEFLLPLDPNELHCAMIASEPLPGQPEFVSPRDDDAYEMAVEVRMLHDGDRKIMSLSGRFMAPYPEAYDALDQLLICSDRFVDDSGGIAALRNWIARGGRAWIMLDLVGIDAVRTLLGNATPYEIVDRIEMTEFAIETPASVSVGGKLSETWRAEEPVELVRVLTDSVDVHSSIDGWPAAFSIPFGNGYVMMTTLSARGWIYQFDEFADRLDESLRTSGPTDALRQLANQFNQTSSGEPILSDDLRPILSEQLGYRVPSRSIAATILGLNCLVILIAGTWLARREQLERVAWVVLAASSVSAIVLVSIGSANTSSIPATSSILRLANISSETNEIHADTIAAFYSPDTVELPLQIDLSGVVEPDVQDLQGVAKRVVWNDNGQARWEQVDVASGSVRFARAKESVVLEHPLRAHATFGPNGLEGRITGLGQLGTPSDAIIAAPPAPNSDATINAQGVFRAGPNDLLSESEYLGGAILTDEQQRRQTIYRQILTPRRERVYPQRSTLFVWGDALELGLSSPDLFQQSGATLYAVPLDIGRTPAKQPFLVPPTFIRITNAAARQGASAAYNPRTGQWMKDATLPTQSSFQFLLPREVVPCKVQNAEITLKIHAPSRTVELTGLKDGEPVVVESRDSPSGTFTFTITDPKLLSLDEAGGLQFGVVVSPTKSQAEAAAKRQLYGNELPNLDGPNDPDTTFDHTTWQIDYLRLQASGETL